MDVCVQLRKISVGGQPMEHLNYHCPVPVSEVPNVNIVKTLGPQGFLRASHAISRRKPFPNDIGSNSGNEDEESQEVFYSHDRREPVTPGSIVPLDITLWPMGMVFGPNEGILLRVSGHDMNYPELEVVRLRETDDENVGVHTIWAGGSYDSHLVIPIISKV
ncbi:hypothetical protein LTR84_011952 [Exophiala bonariae]|uniref:Xaa-Pro dipeptidyl-peptidase C-terminal domain-containing protein n=1 Tax=Exophiala bonariae TaxID=1690606 RepID=A0AAV9MUG6_9EURO|nr:hypothetical protein LTR84_011952 [Exophiala bonariae]